MWIRLSVDVRPDGRVCGLSYETHDDLGSLTSISTVGPFADRTEGMGDALDVVWTAARERLGLLPLERQRSRLATNTSPFPK